VDWHCYADLGVWVLLVRQVLKATGKQFGLLFRFCLKGQQQEPASSTEEKGVVAVRN